MSDERCQATLAWNPLTDGPVKCQRGAGHRGGHRWGLYAWIEGDGADWRPLTDAECLEGQP